MSNKKKVKEPFVKHVAGVPCMGLQCCVECGAVLLDARTMMTAEGDTVGSWEPGPLYNVANFWCKEIKAGTPWVACTEVASKEETDAPAAVVEATVEVSDGHGAASGEVVTCPFRLLALWLMVHRRSVVQEADIPLEAKRELMRELGYSADVLEEG